MLDDINVGCLRPFSGRKLLVEEDRTESIQLPRKCVFQAKKKAHVG
jgi:hypothetical protein